MRRRRELGFTLVEMLVVLAIIGVMAGVTVLGMGSAGRNASVQAEAQRFAASIQLAADEALVTDRRLGLGWDGEGYSFLEWNSGQGQWQPHGSADLGGRHELPDEMSLEGASSEGPVPIGDGVAGEPVVFTFTGGSDRWNVRFDGLNAAAVPASRG